MNFRPPAAIHTVRVILALALLAFGGSGLYFIVTGMPEMPGATPAIIAASAGLLASGLLVTAKLVELVTGVMLLINWRPALAVLLVAPVTVGIMVYDAVLYLQQPVTLIPIAVVALANAYLGYAYWPKYRGLFTA